MIGSFVVGAAALVVIGILVFGSGQFLKEKLDYVLYFDRSVEGLYVGSPVNFRGVKVGSVADIVVELDIGNEASSVRTPVYIQLTVGGVRQAGVEVDSALDAREVVDVLVQRGLRASMQAQSLVTGQLSIALDFHPGTEPRLSGFANEVPELPTIPSSFDEITQTAMETAALLRKLPLEDLFSQVMGVAQEMNQLLIALNQVDIPASLAVTLEAMQQSARGAAQLLHGLNAQVSPLTASLAETSAAARLLMEQDAAAALRGLTTTLRDTQQLVQRLDGRLVPLAASLQDTSLAARRALEQAQGTLSTVGGAVGEESPLRYDMTQALEELAAAARSVRVLAEALERRPEAFLYGKKGLRRR
ncbi:MAG TPA: MlaD family protein [Candidatus Entotheonella sp.]|jgi:paraquat-inducible protein B